MSAIHHKINTIFTQHFRKLAFLGAVLLMVFVSIRPATAATVDELRQKTDDLNAQIEANNTKVRELGDEVTSLSAKLQQLQLEIDTAQKQIDLTNLKITELNDNLVKAQTELDRQKELLRISLQSLYKKGGASSFELLVGSQSFSQFINQQEYLGRLKTGIQKSTEAVIKLKQDIQEQKDAQQELLAQQQSQRQTLADKRAEQQNLLVQTQGDQSKYESIVSDLQKQYEEANKQLEALYRQASYVSLGRVNRGQLVGRLGSTGLSTGPHLHFAVKRGNSYVNPWGGNGLVSGLAWPLPNSDSSDITQEFGCTDLTLEPYDASCSTLHKHEGLDLGGRYGDPIMAADSGDIIFRGWLGGYGNTVIIDHGNSLFTQYSHMSE